MNSQDKVTSKPPKHSCTAEIIAELERVLYQEGDSRKFPDDMLAVCNRLVNRIKELKEQS